jgi:hypothetical protein
MEERYIAAAIMPLMISLAAGAWRLRRRGVTPGVAAGAMMHEILNDDRRAAIEVIVQERASYRDPEDRDGNLPDLAGRGVGLPGEAENVSSPRGATTPGVYVSPGGVTRSGSRELRVTAGQETFLHRVQMSKVAAVRIIREVRSHKRTALSGMVVGWTVLLAVLLPITRIAIAFGGPSVHAARWRGQEYLLLFAIGCGYGALSGWAVGRVHRRQRVPAVFGHALSVGAASFAALPLYYWLAPSLFFSTILPHLPFFLSATLIGGPLIIVAAGLWSRGLHRRQTAAEQPREAGGV